MAKAFLRFGDEPFRYNIKHILKVEVVQVNDGGTGAFVSGTINITLADASVVTYGPYLVADLATFEAYVDLVDNAEI